MIFKELEINGAWLIKPEKISDSRGFFARTWCQMEFAAKGLNTTFVQCNISFNKRKATLRGLHYQSAPHQEVKLVRCTRGAAYDVILDLRKDSATFRRWIATELSAENRHMLYIPAGVAHGFQTLKANTEIFYQMSEFYQPEFACGVRWDDRAVNITWPMSKPIMSPKDRSYQDMELAGGVSPLGPDGHAEPIEDAGSNER